MSLASKRPRRLNLQPRIKKPLPHAPCPMYFAPLYVENPLMTIKPSTVSIGFEGRKGKRASRNRKSGGGGVEVEKKRKEKCRARKFPSGFLGKIPAPVELAVPLGNLQKVGDHLSVSRAIFLRGKAGADLLIVHAGHDDIPFGVSRNNLFVNTNGRIDADR
jgi:hypothetical protein